MSQRKSTSGIELITWRLRSAEPVREHLDSLEPANEPEGPADVADSSFDLRNGLRVIEAPIETLPGEVIDELFECPSASVGATGGEAPPPAPDLTFRLRPIDAPELPVLTDVDPSLPQLIRSDPDPVPLWSDTAAPSVQADDTIPRSALKAAHRAALRRARIAGSAPEHGATATLRDVLVLDDDADARQQLTGLLEGFGFLVHAARDIAEVGAMLAASPFAAVFLDLVLDGAFEGVAVDLCRHVKHARVPTTGRAPGLFIIADRAHHVERVRAALIGSDSLLLKPVTRGEVVRALEDCGVALPREPRRG